VDAMKGGGGWSWWQAEHGALTALADTLKTSDLAAALRLLDAVMTDRSALTRPDVALVRMTGCATVTHWHRLRDRLLATGLLCAGQDGELTMPRALAEWSRRDARSATKRENRAGAQASSPDPAEGDRSTYRDSTDPLGQMPSSEKSEGNSGPTLRPRNERQQSQSHRQNQNIPYPPLPVESGTAEELGKPVHGGTMTMIGEAHESALIRALGLSSLAALVAWCAPHVALIGQSAFSEMVDRTARRLAGGHRIRDAGAYVAAAVREVVESRDSGRSTSEAATESTGSHRALRAMPSKELLATDLLCAPNRHGWPTQ